MFTKLAHLLLLKGKKSRPAKIRTRGLLLGFFFLFAGTLLPQPAQADWTYGGLTPTMCTITSNSSTDNISWNMALGELDTTYTGDIDITWNYELVSKDGNVSNIRIDATIFEYDNETDYLKEVNATDPSSSNHIGIVSLSDSTNLASFDTVGNHTITNSANDTMTAGNFHILRMGIRQIGSSPREIVVDLETTTTSQTQGTASYIYIEDFFAHDECPSTQEFLFEMTGPYNVDGTPQQSTLDTGIQFITSPTPNQQFATSTTEVTFEYDYFNNASTTPAYFAGIQLNNLSQGTNFVVPRETVVATTTGSNTFEYTVTDMDKGYYQWRPVLYEQSGRFPVSSQNWRNFQILDENTMSFVQEPDPTATTSEAGILGQLAQALFIPNPESLNHFQNTHENLKTKLPFVYAYDFQNAITSLYNTAQTESATISYNFAGLGTLTLMSKQLMEDVPYASMIKTTLGYVAWLLFAMLVYRRTLTIFDSKSQTL